MELIRHRRNAVAELIATPNEYGVEVDIRSFGDRLIIHHDAFVSGECFETWVSNYRHGTLILNVKEEGLEERIISLMKKFNIVNYFFLDQSFPFLIKWSNLGEDRCAVRVSEYESIESALTLAGKVKWVWVDCFNIFPLTQEDFNRLIRAGFKLCIVSPELQGREAEVEIPNMAQNMRASHISPHAVCTKRPDLWLLEMEPK
tara:strand:+ start:10856 stop:11461 length:606 start_codon:yes stop_codon:yes gene_type:complete